MNAVAKSNLNLRPTSAESANELNTTLGLKIEKATRNIAAILSVFPEFVFAAYKAIGEELEIAKKNAPNSGKATRVITGFNFGGSWYSKDDEAYADRLADMYAQLTNDIADYQLQEIITREGASRIISLMQDIRFNYQFLFVGTSAHDAFKPLELRKSLTKIKTLSANIFSQSTPEGRDVALKALDHAYDAAEFTSDFPQFDEHYREIDELKSFCLQQGVSIALAYDACHEYEAEFKKMNDAATIMIQENEGIARKLLAKRINGSASLLSFVRSDYDRIVMDSLYSASVRYCPRTCKFGTYATHRIRNEFYNYVTEQSSIVRKPGSAVKRESKLKEFVENFHNEHGCHPTLEQAKKEFSCSEELLYNALYTWTTISIDDNYINDNADQGNEYSPAARELINAVKQSDCDTDEVFEEVHKERTTDSYKTAMAELHSTLDDEEAEIMRVHKLESNSQRTTAEILGMPLNRVRTTAKRIELRAAVILNKHGVTREDIGII